MGERGETQPVSLADEVGGPIVLVAIALEIVPIADEGGADFMR